MVCNGLGLGMQQYRIYTLDDAGKFIAVREIEAGGDAEAMELVRLYPDDIGFEVWCGTRMVGQVGRDKIILPAYALDRWAVGNG